MLVLCSILLYLGGLLVISRVIRGLHRRNELMDRTIMSVPGSYAGQSSSVSEESPHEHQAV